MFIAHRKRNENIIEYFLYMFQVEDTIRACNLDIKQVDDIVLKQYKASAGELLNIREWYQGLIKQMSDEDKRAQGHLQSVLNLIQEVNDLHLWLLKQADQADYKNEYENIKKILLEYQQKVKSDFTTEIEIALNVIYSYVLLKMKDKKVHQDTQEAVQAISNFLQTLAIQFKDYEQGNLKISAL